MDIIQIVGLVILCKLISMNEEDISFVCQNINFI